MTKLHLVMNVAAALLLSGAGTIAFIEKSARGDKHFVSRHSWTGLSVALLLALNIFQVCVCMSLRSFSLEPMSADTQTLALDLV